MADISYRLISSNGGHYTIAARKILELSLEGTRNSQDECVRGSGAPAGITVLTIVLLTVFRLEIFIHDLKLRYQDQN